MQIDYQEVQVLELLSRRFEALEVLPIEAYDLSLDPFCFLVRNADEVLCLSMESVFGAEDFQDLNPWDRADGFDTAA